ncbi:hypothetical protein SCMU_10910 [Sinomonas cyclohexanicum]|uniref:Uncharacterized protein n=1 Tax=Sinomonas cyclohexanicum TaxID=322009 RepID=A0ABM7PSN6_SINCY|nr:hypothetical protein [Corynebacterium cyclohexanicum]BCT75249.1 hypothetical protein SCMU_10910 [Corynebacterium cyclohexanicum]
MTSPFDDPEFTARLAQMGVVHAPGMAARMMEDLAPLLAAEGIDLDNLDSDADLGDVNAALARATERHNLMLFTPVGAQRAGALAVLRLFAESMAEGDQDRAAAVLAGVEVEPAGDAPAISHLIGVGLGLLDSWHTDPELRAVLAATRVPRWNRAARAAATDILALARKGRAFASLKSLHRHGGLALFEGSALLVAASLSARAASEKASVRDLAGRVLVDAGSDRRAPRTTPAASPHAPGSSFMRPQGAGGASRLRPAAAGRPGARNARAADRTLQRGFGAWLERAPSIAAPTVSDELKMMQALVDIARDHRLDLHRATDVEPLIDLLWDTDDPESPEALGAALETLHDYVHFRLDDGRDLDGWEEAHEAVEDAMDDAGASGPLGAIMEDAEKVSPDARQQALAQTPLIAAVKDLLEWVGTGRPVTQSGGVRRGDIKEVAKMLGVRAVGVAKRVGNYWDEGAPVQALSMADVPVLPQWWEALSTAQVIRTNSSSVRRGPAAAEWIAEELPPLDLAEAVAAIFVGATLAAPMKQASYGSFIVKPSLAQLMHALAPADLEIQEPALPGQGPVWTLRNLERAGLVTFGASGSVEVPDGLRAAVARGLLLALALLTGPEDG